MLNKFNLHWQTLRRASVAAVLMTTLALFAGCGPRGAGPQAPQGLAANANPQQVARFVTGQWTVTLNPDVVEAGEQPLTVPMVLQASIADEDTDVSGWVGEAELTAGSLVPSGPQRGVRFTTDSLTAQNQERQFTAEGPLTWTGTLGADGRFVGDVTDAEGRRGRWTATRSTRGR